MMAMERKMFIGTKEQLINALRATAPRGGIAGQVVANAAAYEIERLTEYLETIAYMGHDAPMTWCGTDLDWANRRAGKMQLIAKDALK